MTSDHPDTQAVNSFSTAMKDKLSQTRAKRLVPAVQQAVAEESIGGANG